MKKEKPPSLLTKRNWPKRVETQFEGEMAMLFGYLSCVDAEIPALTKIIKKAQNFDELKSELLNYIDRQQQFVNDVDEKMNGPNSADYGFW